MSRKKERLYIAYGSNLNLPQMARRCPDAEVAGTSQVRGYELLFRGVATIEPRKEASVPVLLWKISPQDEKALDRYGNVGGGTGGKTGVCHGICDE